MNDPAEALRGRLRADLKQAMRARLAEEAAVLRLLIAAVDNAQAVEAPDLGRGYVVLEFGDKAGEVPRRVLSDADVAGLIGREYELRLKAAGEFEALRRSEDAERLRREAAVVARYLSPMASTSW